MVEALIMITDYLIGLVWIQTENYLDTWPHLFADKSSDIMLVYSLIIGINIY